MLNNKRINNLGCGAKTTVKKQQPKKTISRKLDGSNLSETKKNQRILIGEDGDRQYYFIESTSDQEELDEPTLSQKQLTTIKPPPPPPFKMQQYEQASSMSVAGSVVKPKKHSTKKHQDAILASSKPITKHTNKKATSKMLMPPPTNRAPKNVNATGSKLKFSGDGSQTLSPNLFKKISPKTKTKKHDPESQTMDDDNDDDSDDSDDDMGVNVKGANKNNNTVMFNSSSSEEEEEIESEDDCVGLKYGEYVTNSDSEDCAVPMVFDRNDRKRMAVKKTGQRKSKTSKIVDTELHTLMYSFNSKSANKPQINTTLVAASYINKLPTGLVARLRQDNYALYKALTTTKISNMLNTACMNMMNTKNLELWEWSERVMIQLCVPKHKIKFEQLTWKMVTSLVDENAFSINVCTLIKDCYVGNIQLPELLRRNRKKKKTLYPKVLNDRKIFVSQYIPINYEFIMQADAEIPETNFTKNHQMFVRPIDRLIKKH